METIFQANGRKKQVSRAILISENTDLKQKLINRAREGYYIPIKGEVHQEHLFPKHKGTHVYKRNTPEA